MGSLLRVQIHKFILVTGFVENVLNNIREKNQNEGEYKLTWQIWLMFLAFTSGNIGTVYLLIQKVLNPDLIQAMFKNFFNPRDSNTTEFKVDSIRLELTNHVTDFKQFKEQFTKALVEFETNTKQEYRSAMQGFENLQALLLRGSVIKLDSMIEQQFEKKLLEIKQREQKMLELGEKLLDFGKVIKK